MNDLVYNDEIFGNLTVFDDCENCKIWFIGVEVAELLGYKYPKSAVYKLVPKEHKNDNLIDEAGLYLLVLKSNSPIADEFIEWIASEVIPNVRDYEKALQKELLRENNRLREQVAKYSRDIDK